MWDIIGHIEPPTGELGTTAGVAAIIGRVLEVAYAMAGVAAVGLMILGGYKIIMSEGNPDKLKDGQNTLVNAVIGLVAILISGLIFQFVGRLLGVESLITWFDFKF